MIAVPQISETTNQISRFLTNHAYVVALIAQKPDVRMREIAVAIGITERAVQRIVEELVDTGHIAVTKSGRRNRYEIQHESRIQHPLTKDRNIGELIRFVSPSFQT